MVWPSPHISFKGLGLLAGVRAAQFLDTTGDQHLVPVFPRWTPAFDRALVAAKFLSRPHANAIARLVGVEGKPDVVKDQ